MKRKTLSSMIITLTFLISLTLWTRSDTLVMANPILVPPLLMPEEYINVTLSLVNGNMLAKVNGSYPFINLGYGGVIMNYPVPQNAMNISVEMNKTSLEWVYNTEIYPTVLGDWPMINWTISPIPDTFIVNTHYEHSVPWIGGNYSFLYAMGTGRYLETYAKETTAYVRIRMETNYTSLHVYTVGCGANGTWELKPANYTIIREDTTDIITLTVTSQPFYTLTEDLLLTFSGEPPFLGDINGDGIVDIKDITIVAKAFGSYPGHPRWNPEADINSDGIVDIKDITAIARNFGKTYL